MTLADDTPVLWLRARSERQVVRRHLAHLRGLFAADGWYVHAGDNPPDPPRRPAPLAVLDDPWAEPFPELARRLAAADGGVPPRWRVPRTNGGPAEQAWAPRRVPHTLRSYRRAALGRPGKALPAPRDPWTGFAVAPAGGARELLAAGWPPPSDRIVLASHLACYRYDDPADHERRELDPYVPDDARNIVDVGCGHGRFGERLRRPDREVLGIEPDPEMARRAAEHLDRVFPTTAEHALPQLDQPVDCVIFADVLEHLDDPAAVLRTARRHLAPDGRVLVSVPNSAWAPILRDLAVGRWDTTLAGVQARDHLAVFTPASFSDLARECGFEVERLEPLPAPLPWTTKLWARIAAWTAGGDPRWLGAPQWVAVLRAQTPHPVHPVIRRRR